jgi:formylglycine-generating enzyme required for sulfatase activity
VKHGLVLALLLSLAGCGAGRRAVDVPPFAPIPLPPSLAEAEAAVPATPTEARQPFAEGAVAPLVDGCPDDMAPVESFCIDRYEAPNVRGEIPYSLQTAYDGEAWCAWRGKRLCEQDEWERACHGRRGRRFPYGDVHREDVCNDDHPWIRVSWKALAKWPRPEAIVEAIRLLQADMSGARAACVSDEGVYDLTGNVAEWVRRSTPSPREGREHVLKGCYWAGCFKEPEPSCEFTNAAHPGSFRTYEAGFRCCSKRATAVTSPP